MNVGLFGCWLSTIFVLSNSISSALGVRRVVGVGVLNTTAKPPLLLLVLVEIKKQT